MPHMIVVMILIVSLCTPMLGYAQSGKLNIASSTRAIDLEAEKLEADFLKGFARIAQSYEEAGNSEKAQAVLQVLLRMRPNAEGVKKKLSQLEESVFEENKTSLEFDVSSTLVNTSLFLEKGKKVRLEISGTYKAILNDMVGPDGYTRDTSNAAARNAPFGSVVGLIIPPDEGSGNKKSKEPQAFVIGTQKELTPPSSGVLFLRLNVPPTTKCIGRLKVEVRGNFSDRL